MNEYGDEYRYVRFTHSYHKDNLKELNDFLRDSEGWVPVRESYVGTNSGDAVTLILLHRRMRKADVKVTEIADGEQVTGEQADQEKSRKSPARNSRSSDKHFEAGDI
jgi:hypothetical protein